MCRSLLVTVTSGLSYQRTVTVCVEMTRTCLESAGLWATVWTGNNSDYTIIRVKLLSTLSQQKLSKSFSTLCFVPGGNRSAQCSDRKWNPAINPLNVCVQTRRDDLFIINTETWIEKRLQLFDSSTVTKPLSVLRNIPTHSQTHWTSNILYFYQLDI